MVVCVVLFDKLTLFYPVLTGEIRDGSSQSVAGTSVITIASTHCNSDPGTRYLCVTIEDSVAMSVPALGDTDSSNDITCVDMYGILDCSGGKL